MIKAQLATEYNGKVKALVQDDRFWAEQKVDGQRIILQVEDNIVSAFNRQGDEMNLDNPEIIYALSGGFAGKWVFDGEYFNNKYYVFDLLHTKNDEHLASRPLSERHAMLERLFLLIDCPNMVVLPVAKTEIEKVALFHKTRLNGYEGLVFKPKGEEYKPSETKCWHKVKHYNTLDAVVTEMNRGDKDQAISIGLYQEGKLVDVGGCKVPVFHMKSMAVGDVVEIKYLYATEANHVYIPVFLRKRLDKPAEECYTTQLQYATKRVIKDIN